MIVLFNPWSTPSPKKPLPMSLLALGALLEGEFDYAHRRRQRRRRSRSRRSCALAERQPLTAIGVTVMPGPQLQHAVALSRALKARLPGVPIVWGGYFPSQHADVCLRDAAVDFCIRGQGEQRVRGADARARRAADALDAIPGLSYRAAVASATRDRAARAARRAARCGRTTASRWSATSTAITWARASARITRRTAARSRAASARSSGSRIGAGSPSRRSVSERCSSCRRDVRRGRGAVPRHGLLHLRAAHRGDRRAHRTPGDDVVGAWPRRRADALSQRDLGRAEAERLEDGVLRRRVRFDRHAASA